MQENRHNKSLIKRNILDYLNSLGITKYEFYKNSGISRGTLDNTSGLTEENILKFLTYAPRVNPDWLILGKGKMLNDYPEISEGMEFLSGYVSEPHAQYASSRIPLYNVRNPKAIVSLLENSGNPEPEDYLKVPNLGQCDGAIYITGDTMYPLLKSGDIAVYKVMKDKENSILWGEMYLLVIEVEGEEMTFTGYVQKSEKAGNIALRSFNPQHQQKDIHLDQVLVFAHIKASIKMS